MKVPDDNLDDILSQRYIELVGAIIHRAILDYQLTKKQIEKQKEYVNKRYSGVKSAKLIKVETAVKIYDDSYKFLFTTKLDEFISRFGLDSILSAEYVRRIATSKRLVDNYGYDEFVRDL